MSVESNSQSVAQQSKSAEQRFKMFWAIEAGVIGFLLLGGILTLAMYGVLMDDTAANRPGNHLLEAIGVLLSEFWPPIFAFIVIEALVWVAGVYLLRRGEPIQLGAGLLVLAPILWLLCVVIWLAR